MRKNLLGLLIAGAFASTAHAGLLMNLTGGGGPIINADALDEAPTSFLAQGANTAIANFASSGGTCTSSCSFQVLTQAVVTAYKPAGGATFVGLPSFGGQITMLATYTETVVGFTGGGFPTAQFISTGAGQVQFFYNPAGNADDLTGSGFNAGTLIGTLKGVTAGAFGSFTVTNTTPVALDGTPPTDQYTGQQTVSGTGSQSTIDAGKTSVDLDPNFFLTTITGFAINFTNISIGLPYTSVQPADCFNPTVAGPAGTSGLTSTCDTSHVNGLYSAQTTPAGAYVPNIGAINGFNLGSPDFIAQTDFNSAVEGVPEPGSLALVGLALASLGYAGARRRRG